MILSHHHQNRIRNLGMSAVYRIAADEGVSPSDVLDLMVAAPFTPSQPEVSSQAHAPAADTPASQAAGDMTDGDRSSSSSLAPSPSVDPIPEAPKPLPDAPDNPADALSQPAEAKTSEQEDGGAVSAVKGANARLENAEGVAPPPSQPIRGRKPTTRSLVVAVHAEHPEWPSKLIAEHLGISEDAVRATASRKKLKLVSWWDYERALKAKTTEALKTPPAGPQEPVERAGPPTPRAEPPTPPAATAALPMLPPVVKPMQRAPQGRFYLRDKTTLLFVHQSLQPSPSGHGPMMTCDRKWAWYDTMERFRGAMKKWPELANLRKEVPNA